MAKLDDFLSTKKKESTPILDLSKTVANSRDDLRRILEKVPDFKIKPEKAIPDTIKIKDKGFKFKSGKKDLKNMKEPYLFMDPLPVEMKNLKVSELAGVTIDWKMLTTQRPKSKIEETMFSRMVELGKLEIKSRAQEKRQFQMDPQVRKIKNKAGVVEMRVVSCHECGEDFCNGKVCCYFGYDLFARVPEVPKVATTKASSPTSGDKGKKNKGVIKRKSRSKSRSKKKERSKSKSPRKKSPSKHL